MVACRAKRMKRDKIRRRRNLHIVGKAAKYLRLHLLIMEAPYDSWPDCSPSERQSRDQLIMNLGDAPPGVAMSRRINPLLKRKTRKYDGYDDPEFDDPRTEEEIQEQEFALSLMTVFLGAMKAVKEQNNERPGSGPVEDEPLGLGEGSPEVATGHS